MMTDGMKRARGQAVWQEALTLSLTEAFSASKRSHTLESVPAGERVSKGRTVAQPGRQQP